MTRIPESRQDLEERRNARIRQLREGREAPVRRRRTLQPVVLIAWFAGVIALAGILLFVGFLAFSPTLMAWVEDHPGSIDNGLVENFVEWYRPGLLADEPAGEDGRRISVTVTLGANDSEIGQLLFDKGLIHSQLAFQYAVLQAGRAGTLQAGTYDLSPAMRPSEIVAALRQEAGEEIEIRIQEGWRLEEIVGYLGSTRLTMDLADFAATVEAPPADLVARYDYLADLPQGRSLEGYLYPDTYRVDTNATADEVIALLLDTFDRRFTQEMRDGIAAQGLTVDEAVTLASIVEREAVLDEERPLIAGVYLNRLANPTGETVGLLQADPTLQYGLATLANDGVPISRWGSVEWWPVLDVTGSEVILPDSLASYQTYLNKGLPLTPIAAPRIASIAAVAAPDRAEGYLYFVAGCPGGQRDGSHYFARTLAEHNANIATANAECPA